MEEVKFKSVADLFSAARENNEMNNARWANWTSISHLCEIYEMELSAEEREEAEAAYTILLEKEKEEGTEAANLLVMEWAA